MFYILYLIEYNGLFQYTKKDLRQMNSVLILIIGIPLLEIFLFIKIGSYLGAFNTISLILITAFIGVMYARYEGFNTMKTGMSQLMKNEMPVYEMISGAALAFAALLLILPGFATDFLGFLLIFPPTRKIFMKKFSNKYTNDKKVNNNFIDGEYEDRDENNK
jgi:UPF0716 protein FxsA|tara:strand:+ start:3101 stop:3586 length:486 start_codon:yes stop_codon:yes gene_type:complete